MVSASLSGGGRAPQLCALHVVDSSGGQTKTFNVHLDKVMSSMRYFSTYLQRAKPGGPVDISVHCDLVIFELLLTFMDGPGDVMRALIKDLSLAIPIYISSNFLKMDGLVELCAQFIASHLQHYASTADLVALPGELFSRFAKAVPESKLEELHEHLQATCAPDKSMSSRKQHHAGKLHALVSRLYKHKLEQVLQSLHTTVCCCAYCGAMYSSAHAHHLRCAASSKVQAVQGAASPAGKRSARGSGGHHKPDPAWNLGEHVAALRASNSSSSSSSTSNAGAGCMEEGMAGRVANGATEAGSGASWREIFWDVWGVVHVFWCHRCSNFFPAQELNMCPFHPEPPIFMASKTTGRYPCCGSVAVRGTPSDTASASGCWGREHEVLPLLPGGPPPADTTTTTITGDTLSSSQDTRSASPSKGSASRSTTPSRRSQTPPSIAKKETRGAAAAAPGLGPAWQLLQSFSHLILPPAAAAAVSPDSKGSPADSQQGLPLLRNGGQLGDGKRLWAWAGEGESQEEVEEEEGEDAWGRQGGDERGALWQRALHQPRSSTDTATTRQGHTSYNHHKHHHHNHHHILFADSTTPTQIQHASANGHHPLPADTATPTIQHASATPENQHATANGCTPGHGPTGVINDSFSFDHSHGEPAPAPFAKAPAPPHTGPVTPFAPTHPTPAPPHAKKQASHSQHSWHLFAGLLPSDLAQLSQEQLLAHLQAIMRAAAAPHPAPPPSTTPAMPASQPQSAAAPASHNAAPVSLISTERADLATRAAAAPHPAPPPSTTPAMPASQPQSAAAPASCAEAPVSQISTEGADLACQSTGVLPGRPPGFPPPASSQPDAQPHRSPVTQAPHVVQASSSVPSSQTMQASSSTPNSRTVQSSSSIPRVQPLAPTVVSSHFDPGKWIRDGSLQVQEGHQPSVLESNPQDLSHSGTQHRDTPSGGSGTAAAAAAAAGAPVQKSVAGGAGAEQQEQSHDARKAGAAGTGNRNSAAGYGAATGANATYAVTSSGAGTSARSTSVSSSGAAGGARSGDNSRLQGPVLLQSALRVQHKEERGPPAKMSPGVVPGMGGLADAGLHTTSEECGPAARKLRLELLHEEDIARTEVLISHLLACRRPSPSSPAATCSDAPQHAQHARDLPADFTSTGRGMTNTGSSRRDAWGLPLPHNQSSSSSSSLKPPLGHAGTRSFRPGTPDGGSSTLSSSGSRSRPNSAGRGLSEPYSATHTHSSHTSRWGGTSGSSNTVENAAGPSRSSSSSSRTSHYSQPPRPNSAPRLRQQAAAGRDSKEVESPYLRSSRADLKGGSGTHSAFRGGIASIHGYGSGRAVAVAGIASTGLSNRPTTPSILSVAEGTDRGPPSIKAGARALHHRPPSPSPGWRQL